MRYAAACAGLSLAIVSCSGGDPVMTSERKATSDHVYPVIVEPTPAHHVVGSRSEEEKEALAKLLLRVPEVYHARLKAALETPNVDFLDGADPEEAALISTIISIRHADRMAASGHAKSQSSSTDSPIPPAGRPIRVTVAVVPDLDPDDAAAVVRWEIGEHKHPFLLLRDEDLHEGVIFAAMKVLQAELAAGRDMEHPDAVLSIRRTTPESGRAPSTPSQQKYTDALQRAPFRTIPGVGTIRSMDFVIFVQ